MNLKLEFTYEKDIKEEDIPMIKEFIDEGNEQALFEIFGVGMDSAYELALDGAQDVH